MRNAATTRPALSLLYLEDGRRRHTAQALRINVAGAVGIGRVRVQHGHQMLADQVRRAGLLG